MRRRAAQIPAPRGPMIDGALTHVVEERILRRDPTVPVDRLEEQLIAFLDSRMKIGGRRRQLALQRDPAGRFNDLLARRAPDARGDGSAVGVARTAVLV